MVLWAGLSVWTKTAPLPRWRWPGSSGVADAAGAMVAARVAAITEPVMTRDRVFIDVISLTGADEYAAVVGVRPESGRRRPGGHRPCNSPIRVRRCPGIRWSSIRK